MQNELILQTLTTLNVVVTLISVIGIVHVLQEKFTHPQALKNSSAPVYYTLRACITSLAAVQLGALLSPVSIPLLLVNSCTAAITTIITKNFD